MEILKNKLNNKLNFQNLLTRIVDVVNFEGPLLALFEHKKTKDIYLLDWIDRDTTYNRWLLYKSNPLILDKFVKGSISHYDLFMAEDIEGYIVDIDTHLNWNNCQVVQKNNLPKNYLPKKEVFFEEYDCPNITKLITFIDLGRIAQSTTFKAHSDKTKKKSYNIEKQDMLWSVAEPDTLNYSKKIK